MKTILNMVVGLWLAICWLQAQADANPQSQQAPSLWTVSGYLESYWQYDQRQPANHRRPAFIYHHDINERPAINLAMLKLNANAVRWRGNLALAGGTYVRANYANEADSLQPLFEANVGFKLLDQQPLWLDLGIMPSHIGAESAIGRENWTLSRSLIADNSPYFQTGAKLSYVSENGQWQIAGFLLTGWQRIHRPNDNTTPAIGHQLIYTASDTLSLTSSSFIGNDRSDAARQMRYFHHGNLRWQLTPKLGLLFALDIGAEQSAEDAGRYAVWLGQSTIVKYQWTPTVAIAGRVEYYQDRQQVIVSTNTDRGLQAMGYSINLDVQFPKQVLWRNELRYLNSTQALFLQSHGGQDRFNDDGLTATTALIFAF